MVNKVNGTIVECNMAYNGQRNDTEKHLEVVRAHGFEKIANVDITDAGVEIAIPVNDGIHLDKNFVGKNLKNYDSVLVLSHFKGHVMGGYGGALKNISIDCDCDSNPTPPEL